MKVYVFPADTTGCGMYRLIWPSEVLQQRGHDVTIILPKQRDMMLQGRLNGDTLADVKIPSDADVIVFQRVTHRYLVQAIQLIRARGVAVIVDMDDDLTCIHPANPAFAALHPRQGNREHSWENTLRACDYSTMVTVSTPALIARYGKRAPAHVLYNMVPERMLETPHTDSDVVGWGGSVHSHPTDLQVMGSSVAQLIRDGGRFKIAGNGEGVHAALGLNHRSDDVEVTGVVDIYAWPLAMTSIGIGVAPLADSRFNSAKSWLKMAEYAAVGVPCIGSPRDEYTRIHKRGIGLLARNPNEWTKQIARLRDSVALRSDLAEAGRLAMEELTIERNAELWLEAWQKALHLQRSSVKSPFARAGS